ncbi:hypothetical protein HGP16_26915 [Rhizobium sp. P40RR-XXII]|uniref:hypothetical protein n=1 Tax=unclassified Rhizobium TaxID=2613769 RepID=UPI0014571623|nr:MULTISPECIES: hypothetical protein [unclassified Rhizobium]NLR88715.1 hypothetical protein [Rhizobium sp. P28RR-XV]NLS20170.1 hypothetical protein [Rhizobium sp. P40RR-XXII]
MDAVIVKPKWTTEETAVHMLRRLLMLNFHSGDSTVESRAERLRASKQGLHFR